jgi:hypothetical protein
MEVLSMSPSLPLLPEPMVNIWPSNSLHAPTSDAFLEMVASAPLPRPPWPQPALPPFPLRPPWPVLEVQAIFSHLEGPTDGWLMALAKIPLDTLLEVLLGRFLHELRQIRAFAHFTKPHEPYVLTCHHGEFAMFLPVFSARLPVFANGPVHLIFFTSLTSSYAL